MDLERLSLYSWKYLFRLQFRFNGRLWQAYPGIRKYFVSDIIERELAIGLTLKELVVRFGLSTNGEYWNIADYAIPTLYFSPYKKKLSCYFENDRVIRVALETRAKHGHHFLG